ncbi:MAG: hypothetical protein IKZ47_02510 [Clostridia bacterium]|nr:hypothetical protein [Clostridia bacterium]
MKKLLAMLLALILVLSMSLLAGCGDYDETPSGSKTSKSSPDDEDVDDLSAEELFDGDFEATVDHSSAFTEVLSAFSKYIDDFEFKLTAKYSFNNGKYSSEIDKSSVKKAIASLSGVLVDAFERYLEDALSGSGISPDDYIKNYTEYSSTEELVEDMMEKAAERLTRKEEGTYTISGNKITFESEIDDVDVRMIAEFEAKSRSEILITDIKYEGDDYPEELEDYIFAVKKSLPWTLVKK